MRSVMKKPLNVIKKILMKVLITAKFMMMVLYGKQQMKSLNGIGGARVAAIVVV